jgi:ubiquinone/menaquinone biosynthesis C-methylase UbiE
MYDPSVELLLGGTANMMRRMSLPHLAAAVAEKRAPRILDVACGTGTYLKQLNVAFPHAELTGVDLSPFYLEYARDWVQSPRVNWVRANAEKMPFADGHFDAVVSTFLFHELPKAVRRHVLNEMTRVTAPGGKIILVDSGQRGDVREFDEVRHQFHRLYHEPYYKSYLVDDLATLMTSTGLSVLSDEVHFLSKVVVAEKPA